MIDMFQFKTTLNRLLSLEVEGGKDIGLKIPFKDGTCLFNVGVKGGTFDEFLHQPGVQDMMFQGCPIIKSEDAKKGVVRDLGGVVLRVLQKDTGAGHFVCAVSYDMDRKTFECLNSYGDMRYETIPNDNFDKISEVSLLEMTDLKFQNSSGLRSMELKEFCADCTVSQDSQTINRCVDLGTLMLKTSNSIN